MTAPLTAADIAIITPTKGRHRQLRKLLETLSEQSEKPGQVLIADGGGDAQALIAEFSDNLPVQWIDCPDPGQIPQRNFAGKSLRANIRIVGYFDDDMQLEPDCIEKLLAFWNSRTKEPAGVSLNILNMPDQSSGAFRRLFQMDTRPFGRVWRSGYNTPITGITDHLRSQWLLGGATFWRRDILRDYAHKDLPSVWAICEDLIFSYPVGKDHDLWVCADARVLHIDDIRTLSLSQCVFRGRATVMWRYYFVEQNNDLSTLSFLWMNFGLLLGRIARVLRGNWRELGFIWGSLRGLGVVLACLFTRQSIGGRLD